MVTRKSSTPWLYEGELFTEPNNKFGFVYLVTCAHSECTKKYIGLKFFYRNWGKKTKQTDSDWRTYRTSSKYVKEAIDLYGIESFTFEIVQLFDTRAGVVSGEVEYLWAAKVLHAVDESGERLYWNQAIGNIKFIAKEQISEDHKQAIANANRARIVTDEIRSKIGEASRGRSPEANARIGIANSKRVLSDETRKKKSEAMKKYYAEKQTRNP
jgi:hypothetical protein